MFNRLKNFNLDSFLDSKIAEEQAKQRGQSPAGPRRQASSAGPRRPGTSPSKRTSSRTGPIDNDRLPPPKGPDPSEFVLDEEDVPSGTSAPKPPDKADETQATDTDAKGKEPEGSAEVSEVATNGEAVPVIKAPSPPPELPAEVQGKLRRLQKLETKYGELLRSYRVAHARVSTIEPFEASLREVTPLASINDPTALVEYLAHINLKSDMIMQELKKVTQDRNAVNKKLEQTEKDLGDLRNETEAMKQAATKEKNANGEAGGDDFFSYDNEVQTGLQEKVGRINELLLENEQLRQDLEEARKGHLNGAPTEPKPEADLSEAHEAEKKALQAELDGVMVKLNEAEEATVQLEQKIDLDLSPDRSWESRLGRFAELLDESRKEASQHATRQAELASSLEAGQREQERLRLDHASMEAVSRENHAESTKKIGTLDKLVVALRGQLKEAETIRKQAESDLNTMRGNLDSLERDQTEKANSDSANVSAELTELRNNISELERDLDDAFDLLITAGIVADIEPKDAEPAPPTSVTESPKVDAAPAKKKPKNKKKKKGPGAAASAPDEGADEPAKAEETTKAEAETAAPAEPSSFASKLTPAQLAKCRERLSKAGSHTSCEANIHRLQETLDQKAGRLAELEQEIASKAKTIDGLAARLKGEDDLNEEIEGLKDDLMHIGNEHVGVKDQLKSLKLAKKVSEDEQGETIKAMDAKAAAAKEKVEELELQIRNHVEAQTRLSAEVEALKSASGASGKELEEKLAAVTAEQAALLQRISSAEIERDQAQKEKLEIEDELKASQSKSTSLQTDLAVANELAQSRFKDLSSLRERVTKIQPEINNLKTEVERLKHTNAELNKDNERLLIVESKSESVQSELTSFKTRLQDKEAEVRSLSEQMRKSEQRFADLEDKEQKTARALQRAETQHKEVTDARDRLSRELNKTKDELETIRKKLQDLDLQTSTLRADAAAAKEELELKGAQQASAQSLMDSMQDQTRELATQMKEVRGRCDGLEEELADAQRLLMERGREAETMRRLLADVEGRAEARVKEMRERMDLAIEERDRAEEDAGAVTRRRAREADELKVKLREAERRWAAVMEEKEELERRDAAVEAQRAALERRAGDAQAELAELQAAMTQLRDALDDGERRLRELDKERAELRRTVEDRDKRLEKVQRAQKGMADELKALQTSAAAAAAAPTKQRQPSGVAPSSRSSIDSSRTAGSPGKGAAGAAANGGPDYAYLKNVLLQFLEQKDKKHQMQLVPVLGMLLHFDRKEEQKWMTAINAK